MRLNKFNWIVFGTVLLTNLPAFGYTYTQEERCADAREDMSLSSLDRSTWPQSSFTSESKEKFVEHLWKEKIKPAQQEQVQYLEKIQKNLKKTKKDSVAFNEKIKLAEKSYREMIEKLHKTNDVSERNKLHYEFYKQRHEIQKTVLESGLAQTLADYRDVICPSEDYKKYSEREERTENMFNDWQNSVERNQVKPSKKDLQKFRNVNEYIFCSVNLAAYSWMPSTLLKSLREQRINISAGQDIANQQITLTQDENLGGYNRPHLVSTVVRTESKLNLKDQSIETEQFLVIKKLVTRELGETEKELAEREKRSEIKVKIIPQDSSQTEKEEFAFNYRNIVNKIANCPTNELNNPDLTISENTVVKEIDTRAASGVHASSIETVKKSASLVR